MPWRANGECRKDPGRSLNWQPEPNDAKGRALCKAICRKCSVKDTCLAYAVENKELGVWGGTSERERRRLRKEQLKTSIVVTKVGPDGEVDNVVYLPLRTAQQSTRV